MTQLYIGNLPDNCTDIYLKDRFSKHGDIKEMILKGKFAFLTYEEPKAAELAIESEKEMDNPDKLMLHVELANKQVKPAQGPVILHLLNLPGKVNWTELLKLLGEAGQILKSELVDDGEEHDWKRGIVTYASKDEAQKAIDMFHETPFEGFRLQIICPEPGPNSPLKQDKSRLRKNSVEVKRKIEDSGFPVRIVVPSNMIGAIIGKEGKTIRRITDTTGARIDINRKDNAHSLKKEITVYGNADAINQAITMILKIMQDERATLSKVPIMTYKHAVLEILAHNNLLISIFGPNHAGLRSLMDRTKTRIMITQSDELGKKQPSERHIVIEGTIEGCCHAQRDISNQLRNAFEEDMARIMQMTNGKGVVPPHHHAMSPPSPSVYNNTYKQNNSTPLHTMSPHIPTKIRYSPEHQMQYSKMTPRFASSPISNEEILHKLLADIHNRQSLVNLRDLTDVQKQQLILAGQIMANSNLNNSASPPYPKYSTPMKGRCEPHNMSIPEVHEPLHPSVNGYSPFRDYKPEYREYKPEHRSQVSGHSAGRYGSTEYDMSTILHGLEDIIGLKDDSGLGNSPTSPVNKFDGPSYYHTYCRQQQHHQQQQHPAHAAPEHTYTSSSPGTNNNNSYNLPYTVPSPPNVSYNSPKENISPRDPMFEHQIGEVSYANKESTGDFLSNSVLKRIWSNEDDSACATNSFTLENSNLKKENGALNGVQEYTNSNYDTYPNHPYTNHVSYANKAQPNYTTYDISPPKNNTSNSFTEWSTSIPLPIASRIEVCKAQLEAMTGTLLSLSRHPHRDNQALIKVVGSVEGTQIIQKKLHDVCKQAVNVM